MSLALPLDVAFADTSSAELRFSLSRPRIAPLATEVVDLGLPGLRLELHVIGSSHQVVLAETDRDLLIETFACLPATGDTVPAESPRWDETVSTTGDWAGLSRHEFRAHRSADPATFRSRLAEALDSVRSHDRHLLVGFPGDPDALTALAFTSAGPGEVCWQTWHAYPQHHEIVHSRSRLTAASVRGER
ncbi:DUF2617 family protein [Brevibacterium casei]|uniref:DUF2617 family protein n=1 Tax=Brevibacterium casei TaxID=33889 RepID=UPI00223AB0D7|nr:DUF2617 family protein [Brevibacterium casei]MCT1448282.1 DUF2617 family protein [Brevibacterium casei]